MSLEAIIVCARRNPDIQKANEDDEDDEAAKEWLSQSKSDTREENKFLA